MNYAFAGDRQISCNILSFMIKQGYKPKALLVTNREDKTHTDRLIAISELDKKYIFIGISELNNPENIQLLQSLNLDYIIGIHYPYIIKKEILDIPKIGFLNLHPAYLPYNKGWHTPSWAIIDGTPYGATLHFMTKDLDAGDIIHQKKINIESYDTANTIYHKVLTLEETVFYEAFDNIISLTPTRTKQIEDGTSHKKQDLESVRKFNLEEKIIVKDFLNKLRALSTNMEDELAFYDENGIKIGVRISFHKID